MKSFSATFGMTMFGSLPQASSVWKSGSIIVGDGVGDQGSGAALASRRRRVFAQEEPNLLLQISAQRHLERSARVRRPLEIGGQAFQHGLENVHVARLEGHGQKVVACGGGRPEIGDNRKKLLEGLQLSGPDGVMDRS